MGDVAMTVPVLRAFTQQHPGIKITMVSRPFFKPFFDGIPNLEFVGIDLKQRHKGWLGLWRLYSDLSKTGVDAVADLHNVLRSKIIRYLFLLNAKKVAAINKGRKEKKALTRLNDKIFKPLRPTTERYADVFRKLGFNFGISFSHEIKKLAADAEVKKLAGEKVGNRIGIAPFAKHSGKVYPFDLMREVISALAEDGGTMIFLFGAGESEIGTLNSLAENRQNITVVAGKLSFESELKLISNLDAMLSMDSGNGHIAAMFGIPTITLWGATHPYAGFAPFGQPEGNALIADREEFPLLPTSVYGNKHVPGYEEAMRTILPETVVAKIRSVLK
jgi:ADP-heptose:LPS heptosyltransferase